MKFATVTANPAIDKFTFLESEFCAGGLNRINGFTQNAGGKGINVSSMLTNLGAENTAYGFCGGKTGEILKELLDENKVRHCLLETQSPTRENIKITDISGKETEINGNGGPVSKEEYQALLQALDISDFDVYFLCGSLPRGLSSDTWKVITQLLKIKQKRVYLDASGAPLKNAIEARPNLIKPNRSEFEELIGRKVSDRDIISETNEFYREFGVEILLSLGKDGAVYCGEAGAYHVYSPVVKSACGFSGAGDTFLASFGYIREQTQDVRKALMFASAASFTKVQIPGTVFPDGKAILANIGKITCKKINLY